MLRNMRGGHTQMKKTLRRKLGPPPLTAVALTPIPQALAKTADFQAPPQNVSSRCRSGHALCRCRLRCTPIQVAQDGALAN